ncbi:alkanesulfonate monooxygenase [Nocardioides luteus]|uniref:Alkanesulfonate monooxygenase n=1 Tax=Nocardioides luteus TaxID=1844 RepID=A0ABQ5SZC5_9ACTN|nr:LLM class flavin-dependent oxidoreductase [Nocardioides luteus]MDR7312556.1 alkanesulfonate monooxygenase [Nocardioides luteus]GGR45866.1 alkanesulfonate monooxygenase [Nocardioides luteus]GLJ68804.1 alkanesulfonate monooxygenase [Nocardioides luteus]
MTVPHAPEFLWYLPNFVEAGHRGDTESAEDGHGTLEHQVGLAEAVEEAGWTGALLGTSWGRPDTFTVATALAARTRTFEPLIAIRPGYWRPANFATSAATLDQLSRGRVRVNIVSGQDDLAAYGDREESRAARYARTKEFMRLVRRLWTEEDVTFAGDHFQVIGSTVAPRPYATEARPHPRLYFGGASAEAEAVAATEADVQLFWGEPLDGIAERVERLRGLEQELERDLPPLEFGLRITTLIRDTREEAWHDAEERVRQMAESAGDRELRRSGRAAVGQSRLLDLAERGDVLDDCLYTAPGRYGGGGAGTTWLVGSADDVAAALSRYQELGVSHFVLSDTPYRTEVARVGQALIPRLRDGDPAVPTAPNGVRLPQATGKTRF